MYLSTEPDIAIVGEAGDGEQAAEMTATLKPDVILMDLMMPVIDGIESTRRCLAAAPAVRVIVLTSMPDDEQVMPALRAGACSYLLKDVSAAELAAAIRAAADGRPVLHPMAANRMIQELHVSTRLHAHLSPRELEVLQQIGKGLGNKEIGAQLFIGEPTVKTHVSHLLQKLQCQDRTQLAIYALQNRLV